LRARADQQRVIVAIGVNRAQLEPVSGGLAFRPEPPLRAAPERHEAAVQRRPKRVGVHVAEHQHLAGVGVLHDRGQQAVHLVPGERLDLGRAQRRISIPHAASSSFKSGMAMMRSWKTVAASAPLAPASNASRKCPGAPAPPEAMTGTDAAVDHGGRVRNVVAAANAVLRHAVQHHLPCPALASLADPVERAQAGVAGLFAEPVYWWTK
jgi:hypothetical protein